VIDAAARRDLISRLSEHVMEVLGSLGLRVVALTPQPDQLDVLSGQEVWADEATSLNAAIDRAVDRTGLPALVIHGDLPFVSSDDVNAMIDAPADVVIARARDGGTNALLMRKRIRSAFGTRSALAHAARARASGLRTHVIDRPGLALDVDDEASLSASASSRARRAL
jgi:2-phospho-L-lactate guanylyltransferase